MEHQNNPFYNYYLERELKRRLDAIALFNKSDYPTLHKSFIQYVEIKHVEVDLNDLSLDGTLNQLTTIKSKLPKNVAYVELAVRFEDYESSTNSDEDIIYVTWIEYVIAPESKCHSLAKHLASNASWKMRHQPNGIDGKNALKLYNKLTT